MNGTTAAGSAFAVNSTGTLGGTGTIGGTVTVTAPNTGTVSPGSPVANPGILNTGSVTFGDANSQFTVQLNGTTVNTQYDQLNVTGTATLNNCALNASIGYTPAFGDTLTIIKTSASVSGTFNGYPQGSTVTIGGVYTFKIDYTVNGNKNVVLTKCPEYSNAFIDGAFSSDHP